jgi:mono/diheme cytochrome c family protein
MLRLAFVSTLLLGCGDKKPSTPPPPPMSAAAQEARNTFNSLCSTCHGQSGTGDGPGAAALNPKPRNYTDKAWQASVTDDQIRQIILGGGASVGKSPMMPASPQFKDKPFVVDELVKIVRSFGKS